MFLGCFNQASISLRLPPGDSMSSKVEMNVHIRDRYSSVKIYRMESIIVIPDRKDIETIASALQISNNEERSHPLLQLLNNGNQNTIGQLITSLSQQFNQITKTLLVNSSTFSKYKQELKIYANIRQYLMMVITNLTITTIDSMNLQASTLAQLTESSNQLTHSAAVM
jgi:hypothetical protein